MMFSKYSPVVAKVEIPAEYDGIIELMKTHHALKTSNILAINDRIRGLHGVLDALVSANPLLKTLVIKIPLMPVPKNPTNLDFYEAIRRAFEDPMLYTPAPPDEPVGILPGDAEDFGIFTRIPAGDKDYVSQDNEESAGFFKGVQEYLDMGGPMTGNFTNDFRLNDASPPGDESVLLDDPGCIVCKHNLLESDNLFHICDTVHPDMRPVGDDGLPISCNEYLFHRPEKDFYSLADARPI